MDEEMAARFELLKIELGELQSGIRSFDTILFQVKGWCVTVTVAIAGVAVTSGKASVLVIAVGAIGGFWLIDGMYKSLQRLLIRRNAFVGDHLLSGRVADVLSSGNLKVPGLALAYKVGPNLTGVSAERWRGFWAELSRPLNFSLYLMLAVLVGVLAWAM